MNSENPEELRIPIEWEFPDGLISRYANNFVVQHSETEFVIQFFEILPPILLGTPDRIQTQIEQIKTIRAECVGRIIISTEKMPEFIHVLQENYEKFLSKKEGSGA